MGKVPSLPETGKVERALKGGLLLRLRRFVDDRRGVGAIEFAIVAPLLVMAYVGAFEVSVAITALRKVSRASSTVSDLLTQATSTNKATLDTMPDVVKKIMAPFALDTDKWSLKITGIAVDDKGQATVAWSRDEKAGKPYVKGDVVKLPKEMDANDTFIVRSELTVKHKVLLLAPNLNSQYNELPLSKTSYFRQRVGDKIDCSDC